MKSINKRFLHILIIAAFGILAYSNTFNVPFQFDDVKHIKENSAIRDVGNFINPFSENASLKHNISKTRFVTYFTFALNYGIHGLDVTGYHIFNLLVHIINSILVYCLVILTFKTGIMQEVNDKTASASFNKWNNAEGSIALFSAVLFLVHPIQTQAVTYIVQRLASLTTMFYLLSLVMYIKARLTSAGKNEDGTGVRKSYYVLSVISAVLAMKTKEIAFTLPVMAVIYEFMFFKGKIPRRVLYLIPLLLTMLIIPLSLVDMDVPLGEVISDVSEKTSVQTEMSRGDYLFTQFRVIVTYIRLLFLPVNQNLLYDYPRYHTFLNLQVFLSFMFLFIICISGIYLLHYSRFSDRRLRLVSFGILWFFVTISIESGIVPIIDVINEHRVYLPSAGFFISLSALMFFTVHNIKDKWRGLDNAVITLIAVIVLCFSVVTFMRNTVWQSDISLWEDVVKKSPNHPTALNNLGEAYASRGQVDKAVLYFNKIITIYPNYPQAYSNLGVAFAGKGQLDKAIDYLKRAIDIYPGFAKVYSNLGVIYIRKGQPDKAIEYLKKAININPGYAKVHYNLGYSYYQKGHVDAAIKEYLKAIEIQPDYIRAYNDLGVAYREKGMHDMAKEYFLKAKSLKK